MVLTNTSIEDIWIIIKNIKSELSFDISCDRDGLYHNTEIRLQVEKVLKQLSLESSAETMQNMTEARLKTASEMFVYLNSCSDDYKPWLVFYSKLFQTQSPHQIVLTLNRILKVKTNQDNKNFQDIARKLLKRVSNIVLLKYKEIQNIIAGNGAGKMGINMKGKIV